MSNSSGMGVTRRLGRTVSAPTAAQRAESPQPAHANRVPNRAVMPGSIVRLRRPPVEVARRHADWRLTAIPDRRAAAESGGGAGFCAERFLPRLRSHEDAACDQACKGGLDE